MITLNSDTEPVIIAFINRVAEMCNAEVATLDAVEGDLPANGLIENTVVLLRDIIRTITLKAARKKNSGNTCQFCRGWWDTHIASIPGVRKVMTGENHSRDCMARHSQKSLSFW